MDKEFLGNYSIIKKIGEGGMAVAYLAHHKQIADHKVVLKLLKDPRHGEKFKKEANNLARLNDNNHICRIYDFFNDNERTVIVMEFIEGATLKEIIEAENQMPLSLALKIGVDLLRVIKYAHNRKMYHRDIKPGNLMVDKQGELKVIDFGIAKDATDPNETAAGIFSGTPMYAPLEQFDPMRKVDWAKADIYAVGTTIYRMLTGRMPFDGDDWDTYSDNKRLVEPYPPSRFNKDITPELDAVILKSIARLPEDRYNNADEMLQQFEKLRTDSIAGAGQFDRTEEMGDDPDATYVPSKPVTTPPTTVPPQADVKKKSRAFPIILGIALVAGTAIASYIYFGGKESKDTAGNTDVPETVLMDTSNNSESQKTNQEQTNKPTADSIKDLVDNSKPSDTNKLPGETNIPVKRTPGVVLLSIEPFGDIYLDNERIAKDKTGYNLDLTPGNHSLRIVNSDPDYDSTIIQNFSIKAAETKNFAFSFIKKVLIGHLKIGSWPPKAAILINGKLQKEVTPTIMGLSPGSYDVRVWLKDKDIFKDSTLIVIPGDTVKFAPEFE